MQLKIIASSSSSSSSRASNFLNPLLNFAISNPIIKPKSPIFKTFTPISHTLAAQTSIVCARRKKKKRRAGFQRSPKLALQLASLLAANLNILPPPLDLVVAELCGGDGNGGGSRLWRRFGGGGGDGWRGKRKIMLFFIGFLAVSGIALLFSTDFEIDDICGVLGFSLFCVAFIQLLLKCAISRGFVWGFGLFAIFIVLGLRRSDVQKWVAKLGFYSPKMKSLRRKIKGKKIFWETSSVRDRIRN